MHSLGGPTKKKLIVKFFKFIICGKTFAAKLQPQKEIESESAQVVVEQVIFLMLLL